MAEAPRYPDLENKNVTEQLNELKDYSIKLQRFVANALQTIDERNMTSTITSKINGAVTFTDLATEGSTTINGSNITTGSINANLITTGSLNAIDISGSTITGSTFKTTTQSEGGSQYCSLQITDGVIELYQRGNFEARTGYFSYGNQGVTEIGSDGGSQLWISSDNILKLSSERNMSIQAGNGYTIYIGSDEDEKNDIIIGNNISTGGRRKVYLWGDVYINGVLQ